MRFTAAPTEFRSMNKHELGSSVTFGLHDYENVNHQVLADRPDAADQYAFSVEDGDVILLATDGIFDNVPDRLLVEEMDKVQHCKDEVILQQSANTIALMARRLSRDSQVTILNTAKSYPFVLSCFLKPSR